MRVARGADPGILVAFSRIPAQGEGPKGEWMMLLATRKGQEQDDDRIGVGGAAVEVESEGLEERPGILMPCRPSAPPVTSSPVPRFVQQQPEAEVIMMSARCRKRAMMKLIAYPTAAETADAMRSPESGSPQACLERRPAA